MGLSVGAKAGIGVGAVLGELVVLAALWWLAFRLGRASATGKAVATTKQEQLGMAEKPELEARAVAMVTADLQTHRASVDA